MRPLNHPPMFSSTSTKRLFLHAAPPKYYKNQWSPADVFEIFFDDQVIALIIWYSNLFAAEKGSHQFPITTEEMRAFLALLLLSGYAPLSRQRMYCEKLSDASSLTRTLLVIDLKKLFELFI